MLVRAIQEWNTSDLINDLVLFILRTTCQRQGCKTRLSALEEPLTDVLHVPHSALTNNPHLMLAKHNVDRVVSVASHPYRSQRQTRLRIENVNNLSASSKDESVAAHSDAIVEVLDRTAEESAIGDEWYLCP